MISSCPDFLVSIQCMTYNHAPYIEDAMNGFCMQQTSFPYVAIIVDDASTDGEPGVIRSYLSDHFDMEYAKQWETDDAHFVYAQHQENKNCYFAVILLKYNFWQAKKAKEPLYADFERDVKYVALCEGDDCWTNPNKIQKQVDILDNNPNVSYVHTNYHLIDQEKQPLISEGHDRYRNDSFSGNNLLRLFKGNYILTLTTCFRKEVVVSELYLNAPVKVDYSLFLCASMLGDVAYVADDCGCYRIHPNSMMHTQRQLVKDLCSKAFEYYSLQFAAGNHKLMGEI